MNAAGARAPHPFDAEDFRREALAFVDWVASYLSRIEEFPVRSRSAPGALRAALPVAAPDLPEPVEDLLRDLDALIVPGLTHWQSPGFYAYFPANTSTPSLMGDLVSSALGVQGMLWITSPACTELETHMLDWLARLCRLPERFLSSGVGGGVLQDSASSAVLCALLAAREKASQGRSNECGCRGDLTVYGSSQTHSSLEKAVMVAGLGRRQLRKIATGPDHGMSVAALRAAIEEDRAMGHTPCMVCVTLGTTSSLAFDPLPAIGALCREQGVWLHVDAALAGSAAVCPEYQPLLEGLELADSYCFNPHKWLLTNFDCSCLYVADRNALIDALSITPEYLRNSVSEAGAALDYRDWQIPLGRRFRALKLWFVLRRFGAEGLRRHIRHQVALADRFARYLAADPRFETVAPVRLNLVCFRLRDRDDTANAALLETLNASGEVFLSHTMLDGRFVLRLCVGQPQTEARHIDAAWALLLRCTAASEP